MNHRNRSTVLLAFGLSALLGCSGETAAKESDSMVGKAAQETSQAAGERLGSLRAELNDVRARLDQMGEDAQQALHEQADELEARLDDLGTKVDQWQQAGEQTAGDLAGQVGKGLEQLAADLRVLDEKLSSDDG